MFCFDVLVPLLAILLPETADGDTVGLSRG